MSSFGNFAKNNCDEVVTIPAGKCNSSLSEIQYFYVQSIIEIPQEVDVRFLGKFFKCNIQRKPFHSDGQGMCYSWAEKEILHSKLRGSTDDK